MGDRIKKAQRQRSENVEQRDEKLLRGDIRSAKNEDDREDAYENRDIDRFERLSEKSKERVMELKKQRAMIKGWLEDTRFGDVHSDFGKWDIATLKDQRGAAYRMLDDIDDEFYEHYNRESKVKKETVCPTLVVDYMTGKIEASKAISPSFPVKGEVFLAPKKFECKTCAQEFILNDKHKDTRYCFGCCRSYEFVKTLKDEAKLALEAKAAVEVKQVLEAKIPDGAGALKKDMAKTPKVDCVCDTCERVWKSRSANPKPCPTCWSANKRSKDKGKEEEPKKGTEMKTSGKSIEQQKIEGMLRNCVECKQSFTGKFPKCSSCHKKTREASSKYQPTGAETEQHKSLITIYHPESASPNEFFGCMLKIRRDNKNYYVINQHQLLKDVSVVNAQNEKQLIYTKEYESKWTKMVENGVDSLWWIPVSDLFQIPFAKAIPVGRASSEVAIYNFYGRLPQDAKNIITPTEGTIAGQWIKHSATTGANFCGGFLFDARRSVAVALHCRDRKSVV